MEPEPPWCPTHQETINFPFNEQNCLLFMILSISRIALGNTPSKSAQGWSSRPNRWIKPAGPNYEQLQTISRFSFFVSFSEFLLIFWMFLYGFGMIKQAKDRPCNFMINIVWVALPWIHAAKLYPLHLYVVASSGTTANGRGWNKCLGINESNGRLDLDGLMLRLPALMNWFWFQVSDNGRVLLLFAM